MSERVNIPSSIADPHYRYKMPRMQVKEESRLNGVKSNIRNLNDVAQALRVPSSAIIKFFCAEVGANQVQDTIIMGSHSLEHLEKLLDKFIHRYVLCSKCKYPELRMEVVKKDLWGTCNACGSKFKMDLTHKAGKQLYKDVPAMYKLNPEFYGKVAKNTDVGGEKADVEVPSSKQGKRVKKVKPSESMPQVDEKAIAKEKKAKQLEEQGGEVNIIDSTDLALDAEEIVNACAQIDSLITETKADNESLLKQARSSQLSMNVTADYKYYILMCGIFNTSRSPVKHWATYAPVFTKLMTEHKEFGLKRVFQAVILLFKRYPEMKAQAATFCKLLYDTSFIPDSFFIDWHAQKMKLDKSCCLYDRKAEKEMRASLQEFVTWLQNAEYGEYDDEEEEKDGGEETKQEETPAQAEESEAARQQRMIKEQMEAQAAQSLAMQQEAKQQEEQKAQENMESQAKDIGQLEVEDDFDIDDI